MIDDPSNGIHKKAAFITNCLSSLSESKLLAIVSLKQFRAINLCREYHLDFLEWVSNTINTLLKESDRQRCIIDDMRLVLAAREHDLEATKRELAAIKDKYGI